MANMIKQSLSQLPMEDIVTELKSNKTNRGFMTKEDKAKDVEMVAGIDAAMIAQAISNEDRGTVENALNLGGIPADNYLSKEEGEKILGVTEILSDTYSASMRNTNDELYQLRNTLEKNGFVQESRLYNGMVDNFKKGNVKYEGIICGISKAVIGNSNELYISDMAKIRHFEEGKKFVIRRTDLDMEVVVISSGVTQSGKVTFSPTVNILDSISSVELLKTNGEYIKDTFSYSKIQKDVANPNKEKYHMQSDDTRTSYEIINASREGYAVYFKVPNSAAGALTKFSITAKAEGTPGSLICHMLKKESIYDSDKTMNVKFKTIEEAKEKGFLIATSQPVPASDATVEKEVFFNFLDVTNNKYPKVDGDQYLFIIECLAATSSDFWKIRFSYFENGNSEKMDLQRYNNSFVYKRVLSSGLNEDESPIQVINDIDKLDLLFSIVTRDIIEEAETGKQEGVYTINSVLPTEIKANTLRLTTRINREGCYYLKSHNDSFTVFTLEKETDTSHSVNDLRFNEDDIVIIGNQFGRVKRMTGNQIETKEPIYIDARISKIYSKTFFNSEKETYDIETRIPVYRMNYSASAKATLVDFKKWDTVMKEFETKDITALPIKLELKSIIPDGLKTNKRISDRLVFEATLSKDTAVLANEFELQIHWKSQFSFEDINGFTDTNDNNFKELIGRLHDVVFTLNNKY